MAAAAELKLLEKSLGLRKGNKYSAQGERQEVPGGGREFDVTEHSGRVRIREVNAPSGQLKMSLIAPLRPRTPVLQTNNGPSLSGLTTIASHLVKQANKEYLLGSTAEEKAIVQQWLEYRITRVDGHSSKEEIHPLLKDLNSYLEDKVYLAGHNFTLADTLLYYGLHRFIVDLTVQEKEKYLNVSRWFCHIQHYPDVRQHLSNVVFIKNRLYTNSH